MEIGNASSALTIVSIGIFATAVLDVWALALKRFAGVPTTNWGYVGRWVAAMPSGVFRHDSIAAWPAARFERAVGWTTHYLIGASYAVLYFLALSAASSAPSAYSAAAFGLATVLAPWLVLQPGLGLGRFASRTPHPNLTRAQNVLAHLVFGLGLYLGWRLLTPM